MPNRHHGNWKAVCATCDNFTGGKCGKHPELRFKSFEVVTLEYVNLEVATFHRKRDGKIVGILPTQRFVCEMGHCGAFESWLNCEIKELLNHTNGKAYIESNCYESYAYD